MPDLDTGVAAAGTGAGAIEKYVNVLGADVVRQCLEAGLLDETALTSAPPAFEQTFDEVWHPDVVAGGMRRGQGPSMAERVARSTPAVAADLEACPARHCWVVDSLDGVKRPGLLVEWRRPAAGDDWEGRVVYLARLRSQGGWVLVEEWLPASSLMAV